MVDELPPDTTPTATAPAGGHACCADYNMRATCHTILPLRYLVVGDTHPILGVGPYTTFTAYRRWDDYLTTYLP